MSLLTLFYFLAGPLTVPTAQLPCSGFLATCLHTAANARRACWLPQLAERPRSVVVCLKWKGGGKYTHRADFQCVCERRGRGSLQWEDSAVSGGDLQWSHAKYAPRRSLPPHIARCSLSSLLPAPVLTSLSPCPVVFSLLAALVTLPSHPAECRRLLHHRRRNCQWLLAPCPCHSPHSTLTSVAFSLPPLAPLSCHPYRVPLLPSPNVFSPINPRPTCLLCPLDCLLALPPCLSVLPLAARPTPAALAPPVHCRALPPPLPNWSPALLWPLAPEQTSKACE